MTAIVLTLCLDSFRWAPVRDCILNILSLNWLLCYGLWVAWRPIGVTGVVGTGMLPWGGSAWRKSMTTTTTRARTMTRKSGVKGPSLSSRRLMPSFMFRRNRSDLLGRNTRRGEGRRSPSIQNPFCSPQRMGQGYGSLWARSGLHHQPGGQTANLICGTDISRSIREGGSFIPDDLQQWG